MDTTQLECFVRAYERESFSQAAADLYLAQTSLTYRIASLEKELGCELFVRSKRGVAPTEAARAAYGEAKALLEGAARLTERACAAADRRAHLIRVGFNRYPSVPTFFDAIDRYRAAHPDTAVETDFAYLDDPVGAIETATHDVVFLLDYEGYGGRPDAALTFMPLGELHYHVTMAPNHPLAQRDHLTLADLKGHTVFVLKTLVNTAFAVPSPDELRRCGAVVDDSLLDNDLLLLAIRRAEGVSIYPALLGSDPAGFARRPLVDCPPLRYGLLFAENHLTPAARAFVDCVTQAMAHQ